MGCGHSAELQVEDEINWKYGGPVEEPQKTIKIFPEIKNGLLFRLLYDDGERWAFYNDTNQCEFHIRYFFSRDSEIEPLRNATVTELQNGMKLVEIIVYPFETQDFISGTPGHFTSTIEAIPVTNHFKLDDSSSEEES